MGLGNRRSEIMNLLGENGYMTVADLSKILNCSHVTIRSDLSALEKQGMLIRTHGGATKPEKKGLSRIIANTMSEFEAEKQAIARKASTLISEGSTIIIDSGSTTIRLIPYIKDMKLTVVTNSIPVADVLRKYENINLVFIGGNLRRETMGTVGPIANAAINSINVDMYFIGAAAYNNDGITSSDLTESELKRAMIESSDKVVFLADHSKYGKKSFAKICSWKSIDVFVTDSIDAELKTILEKNGVQTLVSFAN